VQDERIGRSRPARLWQRAAELLFDEHWIVTLGDADAIADAQHMTVDGQTVPNERFEGVNEPAV